MTLALRATPPPPPSTPEAQRVARWVREVFLAREAAASAAHYTTTELWITAWLRARP